MESAPSSAWFEKEVYSVLARLPATIRERLANLVVDVEEEPDHQTLVKAGFSGEEIAAGETLFGLYEPLFAASGLQHEGPPGESPKRIRIFSGPLLDATDSMDDLRHELWMTVIHELAHHFGWSERDLEPFESGLEKPEGIFQPPQNRPG